MAVIIGTLALIAAVSLPPVQAVNAQMQPPPKDVEACQSCHGSRGISTGSTIPNLAGQKRDYLAAQLLAFKNKERKNDIMESIAGQLSEEEIHDLANYWSTLPAAPVDDHSPAAPSVAIHSRMTFPASFPAGFTVYQTVNEDGTVTKRYVNAVALNAARAGKPLPDGSMIVGVTYEAQKDASGAVVAGAVKSYAAMGSQAGWDKGIPALLQNGDWDYAVFDKDRVRRDALNEAQCLACHKSQAANSYVFTLKAMK
jgi:cytochrome c553